MLPRTMCLWRAAFFLQSCTFARANQIVTGQVCHRGYLPGWRLWEKMNMDACSNGALCDNPPLDALRAVSNLLWKRIFLGALSSGTDFPNLSMSKVEGSIFIELVNVFVKRFSLVIIYHFSKIQLVVYYQCCVQIGWATTRLYVIAH